MNNERKKNEENAATNEVLSNMEDITTMKKTRPRIRTERGRKSGRIADDKQKM